MVRDSLACGHHYGAVSSRVGRQSRIPNISSPYGAGRRQRRPSPARCRRCSSWERWSGGDASAHFYGRHKRYERRINCSQFHFHLRSLSDVYQSGGYWPPTDLHVPRELCRLRRHHGRLLHRIILRRNFHGVKISMSQDRDKLTAA